MIRKLIFSQGIFYFITGLWPIVHIQSFMQVTGPKTDIWLVKMVGLLTVSIAVTILAQLSGKRKNLLLSGCTAISFLLIDTYYVFNNTISRIYLCDAVIELIFLLLSLIGMFRQYKEPE